MKSPISEVIIEIWFCVSSGVVERSKKCQAVKTICQELDTCIRDGNITLSFLKVVSKEKEKVSMLCASVLNKSTQPCEVANVKKEIIDHISSMVQIEDECTKTMNLLTSVINYGKKICNDICRINGFEAINEAFSGIEKTLPCRRVFELQVHAFWGKLDPFLSPAKAVVPLVNSLSFMTLCKKLLKESITTSNAGKDGNQEMDFLSLITFLSTKAIEELQTQMEPMFNDPESLSEEYIKTILGTLLKDQSQVSTEIELLEKYFGPRFSPQAKTYITSYVKHPKVFEQVRQIIKIVEIFGLVDESNETITGLLKFQSTSKNKQEIPLALLHNSTLEVAEIVSSFCEENLDGVIEQLSSASELISFIEEIVDQDIRYLIDAVEEHSDQFVSESTVSYLIDVHGFLAPLIKKKSQDKWDLQGFLKTLKESCRRHKAIAMKIQVCNTNFNSLRGLYTNIANRGEVTKEIIKNCLEQGEFCVSQEHGKCETKMSYVRQEGEENKPCNYFLSDLNDLRSRAHLIVNSHKNAVPLSSQSDRSDEDSRFEIFIDQVNLLNEISTLLSKLRSSGYVKYRSFWKLMKSTKDLESNRNSLKNDLENWEEILKTARKNSYFINFYSSEQLCTLYDFLMSKSDTNCDQILPLIHFVDRLITKGQLEQVRESLENTKNENDSPTEFVSTVDEALQNIFKKSKCVCRGILYNVQSQSFTQLESTVSPGEIFVARLQPESLLTANVILALYKNTSKAFPEPYQIVFCSPQTTWEELQLLLQRCFSNSENFYHESLFCIANVELLANDLQFRLVNAIKEMQKCDQSSTTLKRSGQYRLALICRGGDHHHMVEQFAQYSHHIAGMTDLTFRDLLKSSWPNVKIITSALPGLGKTEQIKHEAAEKDKSVVTFSISGPFEPDKLVKRLQELKLKRYHCLHVDIGEVSDPLSLDTFLFQLIVTGMVSAGNQFYHLPTKHIYIEIANTLKDWVLEGLVVLNCFTRIHLKWCNYDDLMVNSKITSNVQVVCQYLHIFERGYMDSQEVNFSGPNKVHPLPDYRCKELLATYFSSGVDTTFTTLQTFLDVLADQLLKFSKSSFFKIENLESMVGEEVQKIRSNLFKALLEVSKEFASRSISTRRSSDKTNLSQKEYQEALDEVMMSPARSADNMVDRVKGMIQWEDNNHLLVVFQSLNSQAITAMYRKKDFVPSDVATLLESQAVGKDKELEDFDNFSQEQLKDKLEKIACTKLPEENKLSPDYALTPDNILKMVLIILRVRANVPVIIMGETGCGKTSLVRYLANTCRIQFCIFNAHAGITEDEIIAFIIREERHAKKKKEQTWIFMDEINTCDHLGLISDIICHHSLHGRPLSRKLVFLAACNPYKKRSKKQIQTAGLEGKNVTDEYSKLVYRVHPLPEAMIDYVWDYGSLGPDDERDYIQRMVRGQSKEYQRMLVDLLSASQNFVRGAEENPFCVSLRDVYRCIRLISWFQEMIIKKDQGLEIEKDEYPSPLKEYHLISKLYNKKPTIKSIVLALAHCYLSRLPTAELRKLYRVNMMNLFIKNGTFMDKESDAFAAIVRMEEEDYLDRMELPPGTAKNAALRENVFVMLVCILNRIPIFVVGKPGCSKSLSIQLIRSNLRGRDSQDSLFRELPQLYVVSYQGSESSTSEGIIKVFDKARKYKHLNKDVLPVVLLDEVGLAENSKYNPLKVLHSILEPGDGQLPDVAVVGISNWALDAAKMNRAIHLSRPEPNVEDLFETGQSLHYTVGGGYIQNLGQEELRCLAEAYSEYQDEQSHRNFHGLRDYYSLIKSLTGRSQTSQVNQVNLALQRNFGGLPSKVNEIQEIFRDKLTNEMFSGGGEDIIPVTDLIQANLEDPHARHLMLITSGDSAIGILEQSLKKLDKETITIYGSRFEEDLSEEYNYRILSRIILCMERDCILILKDLESIYGSLYDMLNQNYAVVGNRRNCRVALGAYSNPMCQVNEGFRCIVLIDHDKVDYQDPPFLNRFEKQVLRFSDVLTDDQHEVITKLQCWVEEISTVEGLGSQFLKTDMFIGFNDDTLPSLVLSLGNDPDCPPDEVLQKCKDDLMWIASPDGVLRAQKCKIMETDYAEVHDISDKYFEHPLYRGLAAFMEHVVTNYQEQSFLCSDGIGSRTVVMTFSNIHTDIHQCLSDDFRCQVERLSAYKSEKQLTERVEEFWRAPDKDLFVLQCKPDLDGKHLLLARSIIEEKRNSYKVIHPQGYKHLCIVVHVQRGEDDESIPWRFSFLCGWRQVFLDVLEAPEVPLNEIRGKSVHTLLASSEWPTLRIVHNDLLWCFTAIKYTQNQRPVESVLHIAKNLFNSDKVSRAIETLILQSLELNSQEENWQVNVACDRQSLINSSTLNYAMEHFVSRTVQSPLAKIVFFLEKENAWPPHLNDTTTEGLTIFEDLWCKFILNETIFQISEIPEPRGAQSYILEGISLDLCLPFSQAIVRKVDSVVKEVYLDEYAILVENEDNLDDNAQLSQNIRKQQLDRLSKIIIDLVPEFACFTPECCDLYMRDIFDIITADFSPMLSRPQRVSIVQAKFISEVKQDLPAKDQPEFFTLLHTFVWEYLEQILDILRMIDRCQSFVPLQVFVDVTDAMFLSSREVKLVECDEMDTGPLKKYLEAEETVTSETEIKYDVASKLNPQFETDEKEQVETMVSDLEFEFEKPSSSFDAIEKELVEEEMEEEDLGQLEDVLVTAYCEKMLPSQETVEKNGGLDTWMRNANMLLSLALKVSENSPAFYYLRFCIDFTRITFTSTVSPTNLSSLYILDEIGKHLEPEYLDHEDSLETVTEQLIRPLEDDVNDHPEKQEALHKFSALFFGRCIDTNVDTSSSRSIVERVLSLEKPKLAMMMSPVLLRLLMVEEQNCPGVFVKLITDSSVMESCPCLQTIDDVFKHRFLSDLMHHDSYPAVIICYLVQSLLKFDSLFRISDFHGSDSEVLTLAKSATKLMSQNSEDGYGLRLISAVAFLRGFFSMLAKFVAEHHAVLKEDSPYRKLMTEINSLIKDPNSPLVLFFYKQLHEHLSLLQLQNLFGESNVLPAIQEQWREEKFQNKAVFASVFKVPEYEEATEAYWRKLDLKDDSSMEEFLEKCTTFPNHALAFLGVLINKVYLQRTIRKLTDKEEQIVKWLAQKVTKLPIMFQELFLRIVGSRDFECKELNLSHESSIEEVEMALLVLHIACMVATGAQSERSPLYCYFTNPIRLRLIGLLAHCQDVHSIFEYRSLISEAVRVTCSCGLRLAFQSNVSEKRCPHCDDVLDEDAKSNLSSATPDTFDDVVLCTKHMSPAVYRALHFIVFASCYAGIALGISSKDDSSSNRASISTSPERYFDHMIKDLSYLMTILSCNKTVAIKAMHLVIENSSDLIKSESLLDTDDYSTPDMNREWEAKFSTLVERVLQNTPATSKEIKQMRKLKQAADDQKNTLESCILELDDYPVGDKLQNQQLKRLFRVTKQPCFDDFRSAFLNSPKDVQERHSFLMLFFAKYDQLSIIGNLHHLLKWSRLVSSALTHRISRKDATTPVNDFISGNILELERTPQELKTLKQLFDNFTEAWDKMRPLVNEKLKDKQKMIRLNEVDPVAYCLTECQRGIFLQTAVEILVSHQNTLLDEILCLSSQQHHPALSFLGIENCSGTMSVSIQDAKEKEIIHFQWSDEELFKYTQSNPDYGRGQEITYDFDQIEMWLATKITFGKCYLTGTLNKFIFAKELFHSLGPLLTEIRSLVGEKNSSLPDEVCQGLLHLKERRMKEAQDLLRHMEVLICLGKRTLKNYQKDITLEQFAKNWSPSFPIKLLPEPRSSIRVKHVAALYEGLEDILADGAIKGLDEKFRDGMSNAVRERVNLMLSKDIEQLKPRTFLKTLRRFVFRYLSSETERYWPDESTSLQSHLKEPSLWAPLQPPNMDAIPQHITLRYIHSVINYLENIEKVRFCILHDI